MLHYAGPPTIGGVEATIAAHARVFADHGWQVRIITGSSTFDEPGVSVLTHPNLHSRSEQVERVSQELAAGVVGPAFTTLVAELTDWLANALAYVNIAIVHNVLTLHKNLAFTAALQQLHTSGHLPRLLAWCHDFAWRDPLYRNELHPGEPWDMLKRAWPNVTYIAVSRDRQAMLAELLALDPGQVSVVTPGIDLAAFLKLEPETASLFKQLNLQNANPLLLLPARITRRKNIELAVSIIGALRQHGLPAELIVTGPPGPHNPANAAYLAQLQALRANTGTQDAVHFLYERYTDANGQARPITDAMLADLYRLADGLLFPSAYEGFGIPIIEAGLAGIPIFCSDIAPFRETAGDAALLFNPHADPTSIATQIAIALHNEPRMYLRQRVRREYTWEAIYQHTIEPLLHNISASRVGQAREQT